MPSEYSFRVSTYLTLALACICLGYSEWELLPEASGFTGVVLILLAISFKFEGRVELSLSLANVVGLCIAVIGITWLAIRWTQPATGMMANLSWPTNILPYSGPLLLALIPAKLFRPKHVGDWWAMQGVGLAAVGLAAAMSEDEFFVAMLCLYLFFAVLSLTQFYYRRAGGYVAPIPQPGKVIRPSVIFSQSNVNPERPPPYRFAAGRSLRWIGYAILFAAPLFFVTPRSSAPSWGLAAQRLEVGYNPDLTLDVSRTGNLQSSREIAFEVIATELDGTPRSLDSDESYWRGRSYRAYENGRWNNGSILLGGLHQLGLLRPLRMDKVTEQWQREGRHPFVLEVLSKARLSTAVSYSPADWIPGKEIPIQSITRLGTDVPWQILPDGHLAPVSSVGRERCRQIAVLPLQPGLGAGFRRTQSEQDFEVWTTALTRGSPEGIRRLGDQLIRNWIREGKLPVGAASENSISGHVRVPQPYHETVALALHDYLARSGGYRYSTRLRRQDKLLDPIEDFLLNVKEGHCEWFASAYALLLRGVGIPCQFVLGFRGQENVGEGKYEILQENAHAWVEVLIQRTENNEPILHWWSVDATSGNQAGSNENRGWWSTARHKGAEFVAEYILGYSPEKQRQALAEARTTLLSSWHYVLIILGIGLGWRLRLRFWNPRGSVRSTPHPLETSASPSWFLDYLNVTARLGLMPTTGQTPREFAETVAAAMRASPAGATVAEVPAYVTSKFYRVRYGGVTLTAGEENDVRVAVARLLTAVQDLSVLRPAPVT